MKQKGAAITDWTVDYGDGPKPVSIPHAWRQEADVRWEGPATYKTELQVPDEKCWLVFHGVSYLAKVFINDELVADHSGIWDAFSVDLHDFRGSEIKIRVEVIKNGGATYPVRDVASGFLPFVFNTFGGIYKEVELGVSDEDPLKEAPLAPQCRVKVKGTKIFVDGKPFYLRAPLTWGWYPEIGHTNPDEATIRKEVRQAKTMGFNTIKFCLWVPPHRYFEILEEDGMFAWLELPLWDPTPDIDKQEAMFEELERIVLEFRRHSNIIVWTCGCELSSNTSAGFRERLYNMVKKHTGAALVKDNSGGSEMYGGDLREYGDFYDFHPYCDLPFYPLVLDSLLIGPRKKMPILLGEFNDIDVHRDLARLRKERPYWTSTDPYLNDQGVRWQHDLPKILDELTSEDSAHKERVAAIREASWWRACFIRKSVQESARSRADFGGYVITGWRDTPISSAGIVDDWGDSRLEYEGRTWNSQSQFFPIADRKPPWVDGGNRPGWIDPFNHFVGPIHFRFGIQAELDMSRSLHWQILRRAELVDSGELDFKASSNSPDPVFEHIWTPQIAGQYCIRLDAGDAQSGWPINVFDRPDFSSLLNWSIDDSANLLSGLELSGGSNLVSTQGISAICDCLARGCDAIFLMSDFASIHAPFWREAVDEWANPGILSNWVHNWEALLAVSPDRVIDLDALQQAVGKLQDLEILINRIDTRTYRENPILIRAKVGNGTLVATTLRPYGGLGIQPVGVMNNPAGAALLKSLIELAEEK